MSIERKNNYKGDEKLREKKERKGLQGVSWNDWKHTLYKHLESEGCDDCEKEFRSKGVEPLLHNWFILRMKRKMGKALEGDISEFRGELDEKHAEIFENPEVREAFKFITDRTEVLRKDMLIKKR